MSEKKSIFDRKRKFVGLVISTNNEKTIKIKLDKWKYHSLYKKRIKLTKTIMVHDEKGEAKIGDKVQIIESRPLSKQKKWQLVKIVEKAK